MGNRQRVIYFAAPLFKSSDTSLNCRIAALLEKLGYEVILPQNDGFEFGRLAGALSGKLPERDIPAAIQIIIYLLDIGYFIPRSDIVLGRLDEPADEGVDVEMVYGRIMGKMVIAYRTDVRQPYGASDFGGGHFFPMFQADACIRHSMPARSVEEEESGIAQLVTKIDSAIRLVLKSRLPNHVKPVLPDDVAKITKLAKYLFGGIDSVHAVGGITTIVERYINRQSELKRLVLPRIIP